MLALVYVFSNSVIKFEMENLWKKKLAANEMVFVDIFEELNVAEYRATMFREFEDYKTKFTLVREWASSEKRV